MTDFGRIGVLLGGTSSEREISLKSGKAVYFALRQAGLKVEEIDIKSEKGDEVVDLLKAKAIDCAFLALHGRFGEDGTIQALLEELRIPYTGSGVQASRLAMDKVAAQKIFVAAGLNMPRYQVIEKDAGWQLSNDLGFPLVVKPSSHGSSIGLSIIEHRDGLTQAVDAAFAFDQEVILQEYIRGREVTVGILDDLALPVIEIIPKKLFFDYEAKYQSGMTDYIVPAVLENEVAQKIKATAVAAHRLLGCYGCSRVDMILRYDDIPFVLEVNTIPGLTSTSLLPKAARSVGIEFEELCLKLIKLAYAKTEAQAKC